QLVRPRRPWQRQVRRGFDAGVIGDVRIGTVDASARGTCGRGHTRINPPATLGVIEKGQIMPELADGRRLSLFDHLARHRTHEMTHGDYGAIRRGEIRRVQRNVTNVATGESEARGEKLEVDVNPKRCLRRKDA